MLRYISKPFYSMNRIIYNEAGKTVLYKGEYNPVIKQNFQTYSHADFIAAVTAHIPNRYQKYINYYGYYSSKCRGMRAKAENNEITGKQEKVTTEEPTAEQKAYKKNWAMLIKQVWEVDPLECPKCGHEMKIISVIDDQKIIKQILEHLGLWEEEKQAIRAPPEIEYGITYEPYYDDWALNEKMGKYAA